MKAIKALLVSVGVLGLAACNHYGDDHEVCLTHKEVKHLEGSEGQKTLHLLHSKSISWVTGKDVLFLVDKDMFASIEEHNCYIVNINSWPNIGFYPEGYDIMEILEIKYQVTKETRQ